MINDYPRDLDIYIHGAGAGGCDTDVSAYGLDDNSCHCVWGTINYVFCAYTKNALNAYLPTDVGGVGCPSRENDGETLLCSDLHNLGNCYNKRYTCTVDITGNCHCN